MDSPLEQFMVRPLFPLRAFGLDLSITNATLTMIAVTLMILGVFILATHRMRAIPSPAQASVELFFESVSTMIQDNIGTGGKPFLPFVMSLFLFILTGNLFGLIPYQFTFTSQIVVTFALAIMVFILIIMVGFYKHGVGFIRHFMPDGAPMIMAPIIFPIELISFLSRPISLSVRLFANMMAGHTMLKVFAAFVAPLGLLGIAPFLLSVVLVGFEMLVAVLQAYVFSVLTCVYLNDVICAE